MYIEECFVSSTLLYICIFCNNMIILQDMTYVNISRMNGLHLVPLPSTLKGYVMQ